MLKFILLMPSLTLSAPITETSSFAQYVSKFGKSYSSAEEYSAR